MNKFWCELDCCAVALVGIYSRMIRVLFGVWYVGQIVTSSHAVNKRFFDQNAHRTLEMKLYLSLDFSDGASFSARNGTSTNLSSVSV